MGFYHKYILPRGTLIFCEHGKAPDPQVSRWQDRINPLWRTVAGGCNLNRDIPALLGSAGFRLGELQRDYLPRTPKFAGYNYWGCAYPA